MSTKYRREGASLVDNETNQVVCIITDEKMGDLIEAGLAATAERDRLKESNAELKKAAKLAVTRWNNRGKPGLSSTRLRQEAINKLQAAIDKVER